MCSYALGWYLRSLGSSLDLVLLEEIGNWKAGLGLRTRIRKEIFPGSQLCKLVPTICSLGEKCQTPRGLLWLLLEGMKEGNDT